MNKPTLLIVSQSKIKCWRRCKYQYHLKHHRRIRKKRRMISLLRGSIIHDCIDAIANGKPFATEISKYAKEHKRLFREEREYYGDILGECTRIVDGYIKKWKEDGLRYLHDAQDKEKRKAEIRRRFTLAPGILFDFTIDAMVMDRKKRVWLKETKTGKRLPEEEVRLSDIQTILYCYGMVQCKLPAPDGVIWDYLKTKPPTIPKLLKNGQLSMAKNQDTDVGTYLQAIKNNRLKRSEYTEFIKYLEQTTHEAFYKRTRVPVSDKMVSKVLDDTKETAVEIKHLGRKFKAKNLRYDCKSCEFFNICQAELRGLDSEYIIDQDYEPLPADSKEVQYAEEEEND